jgi:hypothetical protein
MKWALFGSCPVSLEYHSALNTSRGVMYSIDMDDCTKSEIQDCLADQYVLKGFKECITRVMDTSFQCLYTFMCL